MALRLGLVLLCSVFSWLAWAEDKLVIISPHRKSIQREFIPRFEADYKKKTGRNVTVEWLDQGGTSDDIRFVKSKFAGGRKTSGIDVFWGGGVSTFFELQALGILAPAYKLPKPLQQEVPETIAGVALYDKAGHWIGVAASSFGIFYNKRVLKYIKVEEPKTWADLVQPGFYDNITLTDPRRSGTSMTMNLIILEGLGWDKGWELLTKIAGNTRTFTHSSSDPIKAVENGDAVAALAIDFYATAQIDKHGSQNLGFVLPEGQTIIDPDPIAILKGAPNEKVAQAFIDYLLGCEAQKILILPKGAPDGPEASVLGRLAVNKRAYEETESRRVNPINPFKIAEFLKVDMSKVAQRQAIVSDLIGAIHIDTHHELKKAWARILKDGSDPEKVRLLSTPPVTEAELLKLLDSWSDDVFRNQQINKWTRDAKARYQALAKGRDEG